ncbi:MAG TPA: hypothetical protein VFH15_12830 [Pyrinomonadaceae bacterium]|nr:hypothetical protein [Pyrinomonadaceae bacterium]
MQYLFLSLLFATALTAGPESSLHRSTNIRPQTPALSETDRIRLSEAFRLADQLGDRIWPRWSRAPFAVLLVTPEYEFLIRHPLPSPDFASLGYDRELNSDVFYRRRTMAPSLLATFPAIRGSMVSTIVVGQAENTLAKTSTPWVVTLLHEHFHQLQDSQPNFYVDVNALNLARGDQSGMWMLSYAFPYDRAEVQAQFAKMSELLAASVRAPKRERAMRVRDYLAARRRFQKLVDPDDYKYLAFQLWKEGIARYTEYHVARLAATTYRPTKEFQALPDYRSFADVARTTYDGIFRQLRTQKLGESKREVVYSFGAAEGLLLDQIKPGWRRRYFVKKFDLGKL